MKRKLLYLSLAVVALVAIMATFFTPKKSESCGPFFREALFTYTMHPDLPLDSFAAGKLGIIKPSFARSYLAVAYRYLSGKPLTREEQRGAVRLWKGRFNSWEIKSYSEIDTTLPSWDSLAQAVLPLGGDTSATQRTESEMRIAGDEYSYYAITPSAMQNATKRLLALMKQFGRNSEEVKDWITMERLVFNGADPSIPTVYAGSNTVIGAQRGYLRASALFYRLKFDEARDEFIRVSEDPSSPWQRDGLYLAARAMVRKASLSDSTNNLGFSQALEILRRIKDPAPHVVRLADYVLGWIDRDNQLIDLSKRLLDNDPSDFEHELDDYTKLLDRTLGQTDYFEEDTTLYSKLPEVLRRDDMTDWIITFQSNTREAQQHARDRYQQTGSAAWFIAAQRDLENVLLWKGGTSDSIAAESMLYYMARSALKRYQRDGTSLSRESVLAHLDNALSLPISASGRNEFMRMRQGLTTDMSDLMKMIARVPVGETWSDEMNEMPERDSLQHVDFDEEALRVLNRSLPLDRIIEAIDLHLLKGDAQQRLIRAAWSRAVLLGREEAALKLARMLEQDTTLGPWMKRYQASTPGAARHRLAVFIHLKHPGLSPLVHLAPGRDETLENMDSYRDNGWCTLYTDTSKIDEYDYGYRERTLPVSLSFLSSAEREQLEQEWRVLAAASPSPDYLISEAIAWAKASPNDSDVPEALHLGVRLSRYGCNDDKTGSFSKQAHTILHQKYSKTKFAKATPYWFE